MRDRGRREENECAGRKLDNEFEVPEDQMDTLCCVKFPHRLDCAPAEGEVANVAVFERAHIG